MLRVPIYLIAMSLGIEPYMVWYMCHNKWPNIDMLFLT